MQTSIKKLKTLIKSFGIAFLNQKKTHAFLDMFLVKTSVSAKSGVSGPALCWGGRPSLGASIDAPGAQLIDGHRVLRYLFGLPPTQ